MHIWTGKADSLYFIPAIYYHKIRIAQSISVSWLEYTISIVWSRRDSL